MNANGLVLHALAAAHTAEALTEAVRHACMYTRVRVLTEYALAQHVVLATAPALALGAMIMVGCCQSPLIVVQVPGKSAGYMNCMEVLAKVMGEMEAPAHACTHAGHQLDGGE